jgi:peptide/nickel transport system ATP-binding protein
MRGRDAAMVFQEPSTALNPVLSIGDQIAQGLAAHEKLSKKEMRARAVDILRKVGIPDPERRVDEYPHQFSGGQKQRIVIAMALVLDAGLIIADEPTTALDVTVQAEILDLLRACRDEFGATVVIITHNMGVVADLADRVIVMYQGEIVEQASASCSRPSPAWARGRVRRRMPPSPRPRPHLRTPWSSPRTSTSPTPDASAARASSP